jgi:L-asparagine oxygenase
LRSLEQVLEIARSLGVITWDERHPVPYRRIRPQSVKSATPNTLSSRYGEGRFPFHTDAAHWRVPPTFVLLYCESPGAGGRPTELIDTSSWQLNPKTRIALTSGVWRAAHKSPHLCSVAEESEGMLHFRYDSACMTPLGSVSCRLKEEIERQIQTSSVTRLSWSPGTLLVMNNQRILHARGGASVNDEGRTLLRVLVGGKQ